MKPYFSIFLGPIIHRILVGFLLSIPFLIIINLINHYYSFCVYLKELWILSVYYLIMQLMIYSYSRVVFSWKIREKIQHYGGKGVFLKTFEFLGFIGAIFILNNIFESLGFQLNLLLFIFLFIYGVFMFPFKKKENTISINENVLFDENFVQNIAKRIGHPKSKSDTPIRIKDSGSYTYGIDAPWGSGKTSFINMCKDIWDTEGLYTYYFNPTQTINENNLYERFLEGISSKINEHEYFPELLFAFRRYLNLVQNISGVGHLLSGILDLFSLTSEELHTIIGDKVGSLKKRLIVIIDDLDRMSSDEVEKLLISLRSSFEFPNISYVLCYSTYDTQNLQNYGLHAQSDFLEKYIQERIKIDTYVEKVIPSTIALVNSEIEANYICQNTMSLEETLKLIREKDNEIFYKYLHNPRRNKKIFNKINTINFSSSGYLKTNWHDLIYLSILNIFYYEYFDVLYRRLRENNYGNFVNYSHFHVKQPYADGFISFYFSGGFREYNRALTGDGTIFNPENEYSDEAKKRRKLENIKVLRILGALFPGDNDDNPMTLDQATINSKIKSIDYALGRRAVAQNHLLLVKKEGSLGNYFLTNDAIRTLIFLNGNINSDNPNVNNTRLYFDLFVNPHINT